MVNAVDYTNELYEFCTKYKIELIGEYNNVKKVTPIYFNCSSCGIQVKKSYKNLTKYKDSENVCMYKNICSRCFRLMMH